jgi:hypothetical protein
MGRLSNLKVITGKESIPALYGLLERMTMYLAVAALGLLA